MEGGTAMRARALLHIVALVASVAAGGQVSDTRAPRLLEPRHRFPDADLVMYDRGTITFSVLDEDGKPVEKLELTSFMKIALGPAYTTRDGLRRFDFRIEGWEVFGPSKVLGGTLIITLSPKVEQPTSTGTAITRDSDFPAELQFNAIYDVYLDQELVLSRYRGRGLARRVSTLPPDVDVHIEHLFDVENRPLSNGRCGSMKIITSAEYEEAAARSMALRNRR